MKDSIPEPFLKFPRLFKLLAHELHHSFQKGMRAYDLNGQESEHLLAWVEHTSILIEDLVYPGFSTLQFRLEADSLNPLARPFVPLHDDGCRYTGALWTRFVTEKYGENVVQQIWQLFAEETDESLTWALTQVMDSYGGLSNALKEYSVWRYFTGSRATTGYFASASG